MTNGVELRASLRNELEQFEACLLKLEADLESLRTIVPPEVTASSKTWIAAHAAIERIRGIMLEAARTSGGMEVKWGSRREFDELAEKLCHQLDDVSRRQRTQETLRWLIDSLGKGSVRPHNPRKQAEYERLRQQALAELTARLERAAAATLPDCGESEWLSWAWQTEGFVDRMDLLRSDWPDVVQFLEEVDPRLWTVTQLELLLAVAPEPPTKPSTVVDDDEPAPTADTAGEPELVSSGIDPQHPLNDIMTTASANEDCAATALTEPAAVEFDEFKNFDDPSFKAEDEAEPPSSEQDVRKQQEATNLPAVITRYVRGPSLAVELGSWEAFLDRHWLDPQGTCQPAPWNEKAVFISRLNECMQTAVRDTRLAHAYLMGRAVEQLDGMPFLDADDVRSLAELLTSPESPTAGLNEERSLNPGDTPRERLKLFLEAVRPATGSVPRIEDCEALVDLAGFRCPNLRAALFELLKLVAHGESPLSRVRVALFAEQRPDPAELFRKLHEQQTAFQALTHGGQIWHESGIGKMKKHCKDAFREFLSEGEREWAVLFPTGDPNWSAEELDRKLTRLDRRYKSLANERDCKYDNRRCMDRAAKKILDAAFEINEFHRKWKASDAERRNEQLPVNLEPFGRLRSEAPLEEPDEEVCRQALLRLIDKHPQEHVGTSLELKLEDFCRQPGLLELVPDSVATNIGPETQLTTVCAPVDDVAVSDLPRAAALLLADPIVIEAATAEPTEWLIDAVTKVRPELLGSLVGLPTIGRLRVKAQRQLDESRRASHGAVGELEREWQRLAQLGVSTADSLRPVIDAAGQLHDAPEFQQFTLFTTWLNQLTGFVRNTVERQVNDLRVQAEILEDPNQRDRVVAALDGGRFADAMFAMNEQWVPPEEGRLRETPWRADALKQYDRPRGSIRSVSSDATRALRDAWELGVTGNQTRNQTPRTLFVKFLCSARPARKSKTKRRHQDLYSLVKRDEAASHRLRCQDLRDWIADAELNPCFLPQLARFGDLVVLTPLVGVNEPAFVQKTADQAAKFGRDHIVAVLTPGLTSKVREKLLEEFRGRNLTAAVIDDVDFCRLLNPDGALPNLPIALFELVFEQQRWLQVSPFDSTGHGQHVPMELFVGRKDEASSLFKTAGYSRLFSGRKLGKSALLKYVRNAYDGEQLPSGNTLRVILIPAVGPSADVLVEQIRTEMEQQLNHLPRAPRTNDPAESLVHLMDGFIQSRPRESLLVILDEADTFVEEELRHYQEKQEKCLSFIIRTRIEKDADSAGLPRVRFVFSGYRVTNTTEATWASWGDVLQLTPLDAREAERLLAGPLARLGIDLSGEARVAAWMCGYQPAVLLRFGQELVRMLNDRHPASRRERVVVTHEDVVDTFRRDPVRDEIRTVVKNNFQDNRLGWLVFSAALLEFKEAPIRAGLMEAAGTILERLRRIDADTSWLQRHDSSALREVERQLVDFVARQLFVEQRDEDGAPVYRMKFPFHLPVLCPHDQDGEQRIREEISAFRRGGGAQAVPARAILSPRVMAELHEIVRSVAKPGLPRAAIVASHWPTVVDHERGGLPALLGIPADCVLRGSHLRDCRRDKLAVVAIRPGSVDTVLAQRGDDCKSPLLLGGADLLREAVQRQHGSLTGSFAIRGLGRLGRPALDWWFKCIRCLSLAPEALDRMLAVTGGIPFLVRLVDEILFPEGEERPGIDIALNEFERSLVEFQKRLPHEVRRLTGGEVEVSLEPREVELMRMIVGACREIGFDVTPKDLRDGLTVAWDDLRSTVFPNRTDRPVPPLMDQDRVPLQVLQELGLVPVDSHIPDDDPALRIMPLGRDDPLIRLVELLEADA